MIQVCKDNYSRETDQAAEISRGLNLNVLNVRNMIY